MAKKDLPDVLSEYELFLEKLKISIRQAQVRAGLSVNRELVLLYWQIGKGILEQQSLQGWGAKVIDRLAEDLRQAFPDMKGGLSPRNLKYMRAFAEAYPDSAIVQAAPAQITWYHNCTLLDKVKDAQERQWYAEQTVVNGWSRDVLVHQIESGLHIRQGRAITNFGSTLPKPQSELAQQILKDPYNFDFLNLGTEVLEADLERGLIEKLRDFLLELGHGFAFVGSQYHLEVGGQDFYLDLLFYHLRLRCYVVVELKISDFQPEFAGKMGFYLNAVDGLLRHEQDQPTIGLILCKTKNSVIAEYTLHNNQSPIGVSEYSLSRPLPTELQRELPAIENLQRHLAKWSSAPAVETIAAERMAQKSWYKYTDESGMCWRIQTTAALAEIGGLQLADCTILEPLPNYITPRYVWLQEFPRPTDRLSARQRVIIERGRLKEIWRQEVYFELSGKRLGGKSYYGEVVSIK